MSGVVGCVGIPLTRMVGRTAAVGMVRGPREAVLIVGSGGGKLVVAGC